MRPELSWDSSAFLRCPKMRQRLFSSLVLLMLPALFHGFSIGTLAKFRTRAHYYDDSKSVLDQPTTTHTNTAKRRQKIIRKITSAASGSASKENEECDATDEVLQKGEQLFLSKHHHSSCVNENLKILNNLTQPLVKKDTMPNAPPLNFQKFVTMQEKRVVVSFRFTDVPYLRPYFLTFASKLKQRQPDIFIEKRILPLVDSSAQPIFEVLVDGKVLIGGGGGSRERHILGGRVDVEKTQSVFVSMEHLGIAIAKARKKRRPSTVYGEEEAGGMTTKRLRSSILRNGVEQNQKKE